MNTVTVAMPTFNTPGHLLLRAVESVLASSHTALTVVIVNDAGDSPWHHLQHVDDPRLVRVDLPTNRGATWARQAVLEATTTEWFAVVDADDRIDPTMYARLVEAATGHDGAMCGRVTHQRGRATPTLPKVANVGRWRHVASHCSAIWRTEFLRSIGGYHPDRRLGDDSRLVNGALAVGDITFVNEPLYHYCRRPGSLTTAQSTRSGTTARKRSGATRRELEEAMRTRPPELWHALTRPSDPDAFDADVQRVREAMTHE